MKDLIQHIFADSIHVKQLTLEANLASIEIVVNVFVNALKSGRTLFFCGNGGSAADSQHIAAEFIGRFQKERRALSAIALTTDTSILTALANDYSYDMIFSRQIEALGRPGDVLVGISTSGNSANVLAAIRQAKTQGVKTVAMTGDKGGQMAEMADFHLRVPSVNTARIQESHICIAHCLCELVERSFS
jgi:D-sedoheptulose 7-phosphate isomerase